MARNPQGAATITSETSPAISTFDPGSCLDQGHSNPTLRCRLVTRSHRGGRLTETRTERSTVDAVVASQGRKSATAAVTETSTIGTSIAARAEAATRTKTVDARSAI